jgi:L-amino acid N-acyltransferase YncA
MRQNIIIRRGSLADSRDACSLLNEIIQIGGATALNEPLSEEVFSGWVNAADSVWHVAEKEDGALLGFQWIGPWDGLNADTVEIGTFVRAGQTGQGIGSRLFEATKSMARYMGKNWINAEIRADNEGGLIYYQSIGFRGNTKRMGKLTDGTSVEKIIKLYDLS